MRDPRLSSLASRTFSRAAVADTDGVKLAAATAIVPQAFVAGDCNGVEGATFDPPRTVSVTTTGSAATYNTADPIVVTGTRRGVAVAASLLLTAAGGGETIGSTQEFDAVTGIAVPAQLGAGGTLAFGVEDICAPSGTFQAVRTHGAGNVALRYPGAFTDTIPVTAQAQLDVAAERVLGVGTTVGVTVLL